MAFFDFLKKKKPEYDATNIRVTDLNKNFLFDYDLSTWIVKSVYEYDWGDNCFTKEFKIENENETSFLHIEEDDELIITISKKVRLTTIGEDLPNYIVDKNTPPSNISFNGINYILEEECPGYFNDQDHPKEQWTELISWDYIDKSGKNVLNIEQWGEKEFDASHGQIIEEFEISNIYPHKQS